MANENYIMLNGQKIEITVSEERLRELGLIPEKKSPFERVEKNNRYWHINEAGHPAWFCDHYTTYEDDLFDAANYCTDKDIIMQRAMHEKLNRLLWRFSMENDGDKIDWKDFKKSKWFIFLNKLSDELRVSDYTYTNLYGVIFFSTKAIAQKALDEIVKPFIKEHPKFRW